jgi:2-desacetyl-2-hydroxyethyl bacteriochlorophyllide A dehydrogenase
VAGGIARALLFAGPRRITFEDVALGAPPPGHALVETRVSAISAGTELLAFRGQLPADAALDETLSALGGGTFAYPFRYGYASVGRVVALGDGDRDGGDRGGGISIGRTVFAFQPHASAFVAPVGELLPVPDALAPESAALLAHAETAVNLILDGAPLLGEKVLVIGQGIVGLLVTALLARFPLAALVAAEPLPARARAARALGATVIAADAAAVQAALGARGADLVYELSGDPRALDLAVAAAGHEARIVVGSWYGDKRAAVDLGGRFHRRRLRLLSSQVSHIGAALSARWDRARRFDAAWDALARVDARALVTHRFPFVEAQAAYDLLDRQPGEALQVLLTHAPPGDDAGTEPPPPGKAKTR